MTCNDCKHSYQCYLLRHGKQDLKPCEDFEKDDFTPEGESILLPGEKYE